MPSSGSIVLAPSFERTDIPGLACTPALFISVYREPSPQLPPTVYRASLPRPLLYEVSLLNQRGCGRARLWAMPEFPPILSWIYLSLNVRDTGKIDGEGLYGEFLDR